MSVLSAFSARPDGATSVLLGLAAALAAERRVLAIDLRRSRPEMAALLDLPESPNVYELALRYQLAAVAAAELESSVHWRDGLGVLAGSWLLPWQREEITPHFVDSLLTAATACFQDVLVDLGRPRATFPASLLGGVLLWVVSPDRLGMEALDRTVDQLEALECRWRRSAKVVLNQVTDRSWRWADRFIEREYGMEVAGQLPLAPAYWQSVQASHSLRALYVPVPDRRRYLRVYGEEAWTTRQAVTRLADILLPARPRSAAALEG